VFITTGPSTNCLRGGGGYGRTCATRDDDPRPVWTRLTITHWFLSFGNRTQNSRVTGARPNHQPIGGSDPNHQEIWRTPRGVWETMEDMCVCVFITAGPSTKLFACGGGIWEVM
jgi:hypothetical protein